MKTSPAPPRSNWLAGIAAACLASTTGCSSVIGSAYLREAWLDAVEHAADSAAEAKSEATRGEAAAGEQAAVAPTSAGADPIDTADRPMGDAPGNRYATLDEAVADADRILDQAGGLSPAARDTLTAMLEAMPKRDWAVVVDEFTASLAAAAPPPRVAARQQSAPEPRQSTAVSDQEPKKVDEASERQPASGAPAPVPPSPPSQAAGQPVAAAEAVPPVQPAPSIAPPAAAAAPVVVATPAFAVQNACFATRVRAWGAVDRFEAARFVPGQEVIVYFELDQLTASESADGHTTRVDTSLQLVTADGRRLHEWSFEPLEETCRARRRDYFVRYVLAMPESAPAGPCRLEITATDAVGGRTAQAALPLEMLGR